MWWHASGWDDVLVLDPAFGAKGGGGFGKDSSMVWRSSLWFDDAYVYIILQKHQRQDDGLQILG